MVQETAALEFKDIVELFLPASIINICPGIEDDTLPFDETERVTLYFDLGIPKMSYQIHFDFQNGIVEAFVGPSTTVYDLKVRTYFDLKEQDTIERVKKNLVEFLSKPIREEIECLSEFLNDLEEENDADGSGT